MKKLIFIIAFSATYIISAQSWKYKSGGNAFDGKYRTATIQGKGTDFPYNTPLLVVNLFNEESLNFYISGAGYFSSSSDIQILWAFNNEPNIIYESESFSISDDGKIIFFSSFKNTTTDEVFYELDYLEKLKSAGKVDIRVSGKYGKNDISFSLSGSTKAIDYVVSKKYKDYRNALLEEYKEKLLAKIDEQIKTDSIITQLILKAGVREEEKDDVLKKINEYFRIYDLNTNEIDSLNFDISSYSADINLHNKKTGLIKKISYIDREMPNSFDDFKVVDKKNKELEKEKEKERIKSLSQNISALLDKYSFTDEEKIPILDRVQKSFESIAFRMSNELEIDDLSKVDSVYLYRDNNYSWNNINFLSNNGDEIFSLTFYSEIPSRIMDKLDAKKKDKILISFKKYLEKYGLTDEEIQDVFDSSDSTLKIYYDYNDSLISNVELALPSRFAKNIEIKITGVDGATKERTLYNLDNFRKIAKKVNRFNN